MEIVTADLGGTHARFAIAVVEGGRVVRLEHQAKLKSADSPDLPAAWNAYAADVGRALPGAGAIAIAAPLVGERIKFTNLHWVLETPLLQGQLGLDRLTLVNDFGAVGHAVQNLGDSALAHLCGAQGPLPADGMVSIVGPGTGLGVACLLRRGGQYHVIETEGGHIDFAPHDEVDDAILAELRTVFGRVSLERVLSGAGLPVIRKVLAAREGLEIEPLDDIAVWTSALAGHHAIDVAALARFCRIFGAAAGDFALAHGSGAVVLGGGLGARLAPHLPTSAFAEGFVAKGRYRQRMADLPVRLLTCEEPGLIGAAAAFLAEHGEA